MNQLDFLDWGEFRQMGPPIVKLEIRRIELLLVDGDGLDEPLRDGLRRARLELLRFVGELERTTAPGELDTLAEYIRRAALNVGIHDDESENTQLKYIADRLGYIH